MENVKGMYPYAEQVKQDLKISYISDYDLLVSDQFGVAQKRPRLFFIGIREDFAKTKKISVERIFKDIKNNNKLVKKHILKDALKYIKPLISPRVKNITEVDDDKTGKKNCNKFF